MPRSAVRGLRRDGPRKRRRIVAPRARQRGDLPAVPGEVAKGRADPGLERDLGELAAFHHARQAHDHGQSDAGLADPPHPARQRLSVEAELRGDVVGVRLLAPQGLEQLAVGDQWVALRVAAHADPREGVRQCARARRGGRRRRRSLPRAARRRRRRRTPRGCRRSRGAPRGARAGRGPRSCARPGAARPDTRAPARRALTSIVLSMPWPRRRGHGDDRSCGERGDLLLDAAHGDHFVARRLQEPGHRGRLRADCFFDCGHGLPRSALIRMLSILLYTQSIGPRLGLARPRAPAIAGERSEAAHDRPIHTTIPGISSSSTRWRCG